VSFVSPCVVIVVRSVIFVVEVFRVVLSSKLLFPRPERRRCGVRACCTRVGATEGPGDLAAIG
jgi:hypothetical protein